MRIFFFLLTTIVTVTVIILLDTTLLTPAPLGRLLSPQHGIWQNAESAERCEDMQLTFPQLHGKTEVYFDERLVPHVFAEVEEDAYFVQGYLHAKFRLWQMEFQTHVAAGRLSEILGAEANGKDVLNRADRFFRRLGMGYAAEQSLKLVESDPEIKKQLDAYTAGVNAYVGSLRESELPLEYKMLGYHPEAWTNLKTCLFLKYMAYDLAGGESDFEYTNARRLFGLEDFEQMYPVVQDSADPVIPKGTEFMPPALSILPPVNADSLYFGKRDTAYTSGLQPDKDNGSNNWAVAGQKTKSGAPILCNDPHLGLNLPAIWYEMQLHTPAYNAYGVSFPGAPFIIIGFNDSIAFGVTNGGRDVKDYYEITFRDETRQEYLFNGAWEKTTFRYERIKIKGKPDFIDTVAYTVFGPVLFDESYRNTRSPDAKQYAVRWKAHDPGMEPKVFSSLDRAKNYDDYYEAIRHLQTPGQNFVFASKSGTIALWAQGQFPAKWKRQGDFVMPGADSSYMWQGNIPQEENPHVINPERGFVSSANQTPADPSYPYYMGGGYPIYRGIIINRYLNQMSSISPQDMMRMQTDNYNVFAEMARPLFINNVDASALTPQEAKYWQWLTDWNLRNDPDENGATVFALAWDSLEAAVWADEFARAGNAKMVWPNVSTLLEGLLKDSAFKFVDNVSTPAKETLPEIATRAFKSAAQTLADLEETGSIGWADYKNTKVSHLLAIPAFGRTKLGVGGGLHIINCAKPNHGPSWRMVVHLTTETEAYGVYPGGQSGNPGSRFYDSFVDDWADGKYYRLWIMHPEDVADDRICFRMTFSNT